MKKKSIILFFCCVLGLWIFLRASRDSGTEDILVKGQREWTKHVKENGRIIGAQASKSELEKAHIFDKMSARAPATVPGRKEEQSELPLWQQNFSKGLLRFQKEGTKVFVKDLGKTNFEGKEAKLVRVVFHLLDKRRYSYQAVVDSESGKQLTSFGQSKYEFIGKIPLDTKLVLPPQ